jgi:5-carboxymethyl-2-hydroxymuconate isomerase
MPHAVLEYSANIAPSVRTSGIVADIHRIMLDCGLFTPDSIKTRAYSTDMFHVGQLAEEGSFAHVTIALLAGRIVEQRKMLSDNMLALLKASLPHADSLTVEIREMDKDTYGK